MTQRRYQQQESSEDAKKTPGGSSSGQQGGAGLGQSILQPVADSLSRVARRTTQTYAVFGASERMYKVCSKQAAYDISDEMRKTGALKTTEDGEEIGTSAGGVWHSELDLLPTFSTWAHVTMLHLYLLVVRLRCLDKESYTMWQSALTDHFFHEAEDKMEFLHGMSSRSIRQRYLQDLFQQWRGVLLAYDEGISRGDAVLAGALWRSIFKASEDVDPRRLAALVAWMRMTLQKLDRMNDLVVPMYAETVFKAPLSPELLALVDEPAKELEGLLGGKKNTAETPAKAPTPAAA